MEILRGEGVSSGIAFGIIHFSGKERSHAEKRIVEDWQGETVRYEKAREKATGELEKLYAQTLEKLGEENAQLFEIHRMMLEDPDFSGCITEMIRKEHVNAECAVEAAAHRFSDLFSSMEDEYMQGRAADVKDISHRLLRILENGSDETAGPEKQQGAVILAGDDFTPSETGYNSCVRSAHPGGLPKLPHSHFCPHNGNPCRHRIGGTSTAPIRGNGLHC